jgi:hypothetical protein
MSIWTLLVWVKVPGENVFFVLLMGGLAALASMVLVAAIQRLETAEGSLAFIV